MPGITSRIAEARRDLGAMATALGVVGGGGSPNEMRSDAGIMLGMGVEETLTRHIDLLTAETVSVNATALVNDQGITTFSFAQDHYIQNIQVGGVTTPANMLFVALTQLRFAAGVSNVIYFSDSSDEIIFSAGNLPMTALNILSLSPNTLPLTYPIFGLAETDYTFRARADAVGGVVMAIFMTVTRAPKGVPIPH